MNQSENSLKFFLLMNKYFIKLLKYKQQKIKVQVSKIL